MDMAEQSGTGQVKLLGTWASPFALRARVALHLKSVPYEYVEEDILQSKSELLLKYNPIHKKVPVLIHCDKPICESLNIVQYVDEVWPSDPAILPSLPFDRAVARFWDMYIDEHCSTSISGVAGAKDEETRKAALEKLEECVGLLEEAFKTCSKGKGFFGGDHIGFIDIAFGSLLAPLRAVERLSGTQVLRPDTTPCLVQWADRFCAHDSVKPFMPDIDKLIQFAFLKFNIK